jgi:very-short-patch-repair endonuclease
MQKQPEEATLHVYPLILQRAREMRHPLTPAEKKVWDRVRNQQLGYKIRRQHPIYRFIADFYCAKVKLVIRLMATLMPNPIKQTMMRREPNG